MRVLHFSPSRLGFAKTPLTLGLVVGFVVDAVSSPAMAQSMASAPSSEGGGYLPWIIALGIIVVTGATAFINPKRSHLA